MSKIKQQTETTVRHTTPPYDASAMIHKHLHFQDMSMILLSYPEEPLVVLRSSNVDRERIEVHRDMLAVKMRESIVRSEAK